MGINDDVRIGALPSIAPSEPVPATPPPDGYEWVRSATTGHWHLFRKMTDEERIYLGRQSPSLADEPDPGTRRVIEQEGARPSSLVSVHRSVVRDPLHELQLLRDLKIVNERTEKELGPLPYGEMPMQETRRPQSQHVATVGGQGRSDVGHDASVEADAAGEGDSMKIRDIAMVTALGVASLSAKASSPTQSPDRVAGSLSTETGATTIPPYSFPPSRMGPPIAEGQPPAQIVASPDMTPPPSKGMVLYGAFFDSLIDKQAAREKVDFAIASLSLGDGAWAGYWYGHRFHLRGKEYFVGFLSSTDGCGSHCESRYLIRSKKAYVGEATFVQSPQGDENMMTPNVPWKWISGDSAIGKFGSFEKGNIVLPMSPRTYWTPAGHYLLAVPTEHMLGDGFNNNESEIFELDPYFLIHGELKSWDGFVWRHVGTIVTGENNDGQCSPDVRHSSDYPPCWGSTGDMRFVQEPDSDLPVIEVRRKGSELDGFSRIRAVDTQAVTTWRFDEASKSYTEVKL